MSQGPQLLLEEKCKSVVLRDEGESHPQRLQEHKNEIVYSTAWELSKFQVKYIF